MIEDKDERPGSHRTEERPYDKTVDKDDTPLLSRRLDSPYDTTVDKDDSPSKAVCTDERPYETTVDRDDTPLPNVFVVVVAPMRTLFAYTLPPTAVIVVSAIWTPDVTTPSEAFNVAQFKFSIVADVAATLLATTVPLTSTDPADRS